MSSERLGSLKAGPTKVNTPQRWDQKDGLGGESGMRCAYHNQKAGNPRKLAFQADKDLWV